MSFAGKKVMVTSGAGFIGSQLCEELVAGDFWGTLKIALAGTGALLGR